VDFFTGRGATEGASIAAAAAAGGASPDGAGGAASSSLSPEAQATVGRRLALGAVAATGLGAFALVPTSELALLKPRQPMFFYIASLLQAQVREGGKGVSWMCWVVCSRVRPSEGRGRGRLRQGMPEASNHTHTRNPTPPNLATGAAG
jgi:hypothetical protein